MSVNQFDHTHLQQQRNNDRDIINLLVENIDFCGHSTSISQFSKSRKICANHQSYVWCFEFDRRTVLSFPATHRYMRISRTNPIRKKIFRCDVPDRLGAKSLQRLCMDEVVTAFGYYSLHRV